MARIPLTTYAKLSEGTHILKITDVEYKEDFGKLNVFMENEKGVKHIERFSLRDNRGEWNSRALTALTYFAQNALNDFTAEDFDHKDLIGHYIKVSVNYTEPDAYGKSYVRLGDKSPASSFSDEDSKPKFDLNELLGLEDE